MKFSIGLIFILFCQFSFGQDQWINYTSNNEIFDIAETQDGIWLGTEGGLAYFDVFSGEEIYYNSGNSLIPSNRVVDILYQEDEDLWATTYQGICKINKGEMTVGPQISGPMRETLDGKIIVAGTDNLYVQDEGMDFKTFEYPSFSVEINGLEVDQVTGSIYVNVINYYSESYLAEWKDGEWNIQLQGNMFSTAMTLDKENRLWFFDSSGLQYFENDVWNLIPESAAEGSNYRPTLYVNTDNEIVYALKQNQDCTILKIWDGTELKELNYSPDDCLLYNFVGPSKRESDLYYGSHSLNGMYRFRSDQIFGFTQLTQSPLISNYVQNTLHASDGSHFVIYTNRIHKIESGIWTEIDLPSAFEERINKGFLDEDEDLWIHTNDVLWEFKDGEWEQLPLPSEITESVSLMAVGKNGDIWIQSKLYLARFRDFEWKIFTTAHHGISTTIFQDMEVDPENGDLWVSTFQGVRQYDGTTWRSYNLEPVNHFFEIEMGRGGAFTLKNSQIYFMKDGVFDSIPFPDQGEHNGFFSDIAYDAINDRIYLSGILSLSVLDDDEWTNYTTANSGLYSSGNNDIRFDIDENLWMSGRGAGICIFNPEGITTLSVDDKFEEDNSPSIKIYPSLVSDDYFYLESEKSGTFQIMVTDITGRVVYDQNHRISQITPELIELPHSARGLLLVSFIDGKAVASRKIYRN